MSEAFDLSLFLAVFLVVSSSILLTYLLVQWKKTSREQLKRDDRYPPGY